MDQPTSGPEPEVPRDAIETPAEAPAEAPAPQPLGVPIAPTGHAGVDERVGRLAAVDHLAVSGHVEVYEDVHRGLRDALAALDQRPGPHPPTRHDAPTPAEAPGWHDNRS